ncbi:MAG: hypothetical protein ACFCGT_28300 [Sandaracinaceae bacterium]
MSDAESAPRVPFDPREERVIAGLARWMGLLGRFQILAAVAILLGLLTVLGLVTTADVFEPQSAPASDTPPLVSIGEVEPEATALAILGIGVLGLLFFRGGLHLIAGAEDLEAAIGPDDLSQHYLEEALRKLRGYFMLELVVVSGLGLILGWVGTL